MRLTLNVRLPAFTQQAMSWLNSFAPQEKVNDLSYWLNDWYHYIQTKLEPETDFFINAQQENGFSRYLLWRNNFNSEMRLLRQELIHSYWQGGLLTPINLRQQLIEQQKTFTSEVVSALYYTGTLKRLAKQLPVYAHTFEGAINAFEIKLKKYPQQAIHYFYNDIMNHIVLMSGNKLEVEKLLRALTFYSTLVPTDFFQPVVQVLKNFKPVQEQAKIQDPILGLIPTVAIKLLIKQINSIFAPAKNNEAAVDSITRFADKLQATVGGLISYSQKNPSTAIAATLGAAALTYSACSIASPSYLTALSDYGNLQEQSFYTLSGITISYGFAKIVLLSDQLMTATSILTGLSLLTQVQSVGAFALQSSPVKAESSTVIPINLIKKRLLSKRAVDTEINIYDSGRNELPAVTALQNGNMLVIWAKYNSATDADIKGCLIDPTGFLLGGLLTINTGLTYIQDQPQVAQLKNGTVAAVWASQPTLEYPTYNIYGQLLHSNGTKTNSEFQINTYTSDNQQKPAVAPLIDGGFVVVWESQYQDGSSYGIFGRRYDSNGNSLGDEFMANSYVDGTQYSPSVAALNDGGFIVVWNGKGVDGTNGTYGQRFNAAGNPVNSPITIKISSSYNPKVIGLNDGGFFVTYTASGDAWDVYGQFFDANGAKVGNEILINTTRASTQYFPVASLLASGDVLVAWQSNDEDGSGFGIYAQVISTATKAKLGIPIRLNNNTTGSQEDVNLARLADGNVMAVWTDRQNVNAPSIKGKVISTQVALNYPEPAFGFGKNTPAPMRSPLVINNPDFMPNATVTFTLSDPAAGQLTTGSNNTVTSTFNHQTGTWQVTGNVNEINNLLASSFIFQPAANYTKNFSINAQITNGLGQAYNNTLQAVYTRETLINTETFGNQYNVDIAKLKNGNSVTVWQGNQTGNTAIYGRIITQAGIKVGSEFLISPTASNGANYPAVTALANGNFFVVWQTSSTGDVQAQICDSNGVKINLPFLISNTAGSNFYTVTSNPKACTLSNGNVVVIWWGNSASQAPDVIGRLVSASGSLLGSEFRINTTTSNNQYYPTVTALNNGHFAVTWMSMGQDGADGGIYISVFDANANNISGEILVNSITAGNQSNPHVAKLTDGKFVVVWNGQIAPNQYQVYYKVFSASGVALTSNDILVDAETWSSTDINPKICPLSNGNFIVLYSVNDINNNRFDIYGQVFTPAGVKVGLKVKINDFVAADQLYPSASLLDNQNLFIAWTAYQQYVINQNYEVYGRIFNTQLSAANTMQNLQYTDMPIHLLPITITPPEFLNNVSVTLQLSTENAGTLTTATFGNTTASFNNNTWYATGPVMDIMALLNTVRYQPAIGYYSNFTINGMIADNFSSNVNATIAVTYLPPITTGAITTYAPATIDSTTGVATTLSPITTGVMTTYAPVTTDSTTDFATTNDQVATTQLVTTAASAVTTIADPSSTGAASTSATLSTGTTEMMTDTGGTNSMTTFATTLPTTTSTTMLSTTIQSSTGSNAASTTGIENVSDEKSDNNAGVIVGSVVGGFAALMTATGIGIFAMRKNMQKRERRGLVNKDIEMQSRSTETNKIEKPKLANTILKVRDIQVFESVIDEIRKRYKTGKSKSCFISYAWGGQYTKLVQDYLVKYIRQAGFEVPFDLDHTSGKESMPEFLDNIEKSDFVIVVGTKELLEKYNQRNDPKIHPEQDQPVVRAELIRICHIVNSGHAEKVRPLLIEGTVYTSFPSALVPHVRIENFKNGPEHYFNGVLELLMSLYEIAPEELNAMIVAAEQKHNETENDAYSPVCKIQ